MGIPYEQVNCGEFQWGRVIFSEIVDHLQMWDLIHMNV